MNRLVIGSHSVSIPSSWEECSTEKQLKILRLIHANLPPSLVLMKALWVLAGWEKPLFSWLEYIQVKWLGLLPKKGTGKWFRVMYLYFLTEEQRQEMLEAVKWVYSVVSFPRSAEGYYKPPLIVLKKSGEKSPFATLPSAGCTNLTWSQYTDIDQHLRKLHGGDAGALNWVLAYLFMPADPTGNPALDAQDAMQLVEELHQVEKDLVLAWYLQCLKHIEESHPLVYEQPDEPTEDLYGLVGLTNRLAASASDVSRVQRLSVWEVLDYLEIKLADAKNKP